MRTTLAHGTTSAEPLLAEVECYQLTAETIDGYWHLVEPFVQKWETAANGELGASDVLAAMQKGFMQMFCIHSAGDIKLVVITEFVQYPRMKVLRMVGMAGEKPLLAFKFQNYFENWARQNGAEALETFATPRTVKFDQKIGMKPVYTLMRKSLFTAH